MRKVSILLAIAILFTSMVSMLPMIQASATTLTEADILSPYEVSPATTIDFRNKTMDQMKTEISFARNDGAYADATATNFYSAGSDGFTFDCAGDTANFYGFYPTVSLGNDLTDGKSYKIKFRLDDENSDINVRLHKNGGADIRFWTEGRELKYNYANAEVAQGWATESTGRVLEAGRFYTYILKLDNGVMTYYESTDDVNYTKVISYTPKTGTANSIRFASLLEGSVTFQSIVQYKKGSASFQASDVLTSDLEKKKGVDFAEYTSNSDFFTNSGFAPSQAQSKKDYDATTHDAVYSVGTNGLTIKSSSSAWYGINGDGNTNLVKYDIAGKAAFKFGFILKDANADFNMDFQSAAANMRLRFYTDGGVFCYAKSVGAGSVSDQLALNKEHVYIAVKDGSNIKLFRQNDDGTYAFLASYTPPATTSNLFRMDCLPGGDSVLTITHFEQYGDKLEGEDDVTPPQQPDDPIVPDQPDDETISEEIDWNILTEDKKTLFADDFSENNSQWTLNGFNIKNGMLCVNKGDDENFVTATLSTASFDLSGAYAIRFRLRVNAVHAQANFGYKGKRILWSLGEEEGMIAGVNYPQMYVQLGKWYEYVFVYNADGSTANIWRRAENETEWLCLVKGAVLQDGGSTQIQPSTARPGASFDMDSIQIYTGSLIDFNEPVVEGNQMKVTGNVFFISDSARYRKASVIVAAFHKEYGYTEFVDVTEYLVYPGEDRSLQTTFTLSDSDWSQYETSVMLWDSIENGILMADGFGYQLKNLSKATDKPLEGQAEEIAVTGYYNEAHISGFIGDKGTVTLSLVNKESGKLEAAGQCVTNQEGLFQTVLAVNPKATGGAYLLRAQYGNEKTKTMDVTLHCCDIMSEKITDGASLTEFIEKYGSEEEKESLRNLAADEVYARFENIVGEEGFADFYEFRLALQKAVNDETTEANILEEINLASANSKWADLQDLLMKTYREFLGISENALQGVQDKKALFTRMTKKTYLSADAVYEDFNSALQAQKNAEKNQFVGGGSFGGGGAVGGSVGSGGSASSSYGGGAVSVSGGAPGTSNISNVPVKEIVPFEDLDTVAWAKASINALQKDGVLSGDGDGKFYPNRSITREEFLKLVMGATGIEPKADEIGLNFADVDADAWYYPYVAGAYQVGLVNGVSETEFGIGAEITRADMAVMLRRAMTICGTEPEATIAAYVFSDFSEIPRYARESITDLCQAELMQGVGNNCFAPTKSATRAEASVAIHRIYVYIAERG